MACASCSGIAAGVPWAVAIGASTRPTKMDKSSASDFLFFLFTLSSDRCCNGACLSLPERLALFLDGMPGVRDGDGKRGRVGGRAGLSLDEPRNNPVELLLQGLEFGSLRCKSLIGEFDQAIDLAQIAFGFLAIEVSDQQRDRGADHAQNHAAQIEIFLELFEEALLSAVEIGHDARMNRQDWVLVVGVGRFDLAGERRFGYQLGFGLE